MAILLGSFLVTGYRVRSRVNRLRKQGFVWVMFLTLYIHD
jgi:hypothetical protein